MKSIRIQVNKLWSDHAWLNINEYIFCANDAPKPNSTSTRSINYCLMNPGIQVVFSSSIFKRLIYHWHQKWYTYPLNPVSLMLLTVLSLEISPKLKEHAFISACFDLLDF